MSYLSFAISKLCPTAEFSFSDEDYSTVVWNKLETKAPTQAEIDAAIEAVKADETAAELKTAADKATAQAKLAALGLTADDLKALGL